MSRATELNNIDMPASEVTSKNQNMCGPKT